METPAPDPKQVPNLLTLSLKERLLGSNTPGAKEVALIYSDELSRHTINDSHPLRPIRLHHAHALMQACGLLDAPGVHQRPPRPATQEEMERFHSRYYVEAVKAISAGESVPNMSAFGFGTGDNPPYPGVFDSSALATGSSIVAAESVDSGHVAAFALAGGVHHHAMPERASGFGVFNDAVIAIKGLVEQGYRVAYVDIDCHHGDGVQLGFYDTDQVLTLSLHESGQFLFPGTGAVSEIGIGQGEGYSVNVPLAPYTTDDVWLESFDAVAPQIIRAFKPDILFTQLGIDTHYKDPLTHMALTTQGFQAAVQRLAVLGRETGKWVAVGGGGYDMSAVARGWTMAFAEMAGQKLPDRVPESFTSLEGLTRFEDEPPPPLEDDIAGQVRAFAQRSVDQVREIFFPRFNLA